MPDTTYFASATVGRHRAKLPVIYRALVTAVAVALAPTTAVTAQTPLVVPRVTGDIALDGNFDEPAWRQAIVLPLVGYVPVAGAAPTESTVVRIMHDTRAIYVAAQLFDRSPDGVQDWSRGRDADQDGDFVNILIDAYGDRENAVVFSTTPSGARLDYSISSDAEGATPSSISWNGFWDVRVRRDATGWFAEFRIPFATLRYQPVGDEVRMGLIVNRLIGRKNERVIFPAIEPRWSSGMFKPSRAQPVVFVGVEQQRQRIVVPYVIAGRQREATNLTLADAERRVDAGGDLKLALSNNLNLDATVNTDFAEAEVDDQLINLGRYAIAMPERRQFFLERAGIFDVGLGGANRLFMSRRIGLTSDGRPVPLYGGARLVGRLGGTDVGLLSMQTREGSGDPATNFGVLRLRSRALNDESYVGALATTRAWRGGGEAAGGVDAILRVGGPYYVRLAAAVTGRDSLTTAQSTWSDRAGMHARLERRSTIGLGGYVRVLHLGDAFTPPAGFVESTGIRAVDAGVTYGVLAPIASPLRLVTPAVRVTRTQDISVNALQTRAIAGDITVEMRSGATLAVGGEARQEVTREELRFADDFAVASGDYEFANVSAFAATAPSAAGRVTIQLSTGGFYDGRRTSATLSSAWHPVPMLTANAEYVHERLKASQATATLRLARVRAAVAPSSRHSGAATLQYSTTTHLVGVNARWRVNFREATDLWLVYDQVFNADRHRLSPPLPETARQSFQLKVTYALAN